MDYQEIKRKLEKTPYLIANASTGQVRLVKQSIALKALIEGGEFPSYCIMNVEEALKKFSRLKAVGTEREFSLKDISTIAGMGYVNCWQWVDQGVIVPSIKAFNGKGQGEEHEARFSWADAFVAGIVGSLRRNGMKAEVLKKIQSLFTETKKRTAPKHQLVERS